MQALSHPLILRIITLLTLAVSVWLFGTQALHAQSGAGVSISPAVIEETLDPGITVNRTVEVGNLTDEEQTYFLFTRNIESVDDGGVPVFANSNLDATGFELVDWITLSTTTITVPAGTTRAFTFQMDVPEDAPPGSNFGGIFVSVEAPDISQSGAAVGYQVANIVSIRVSGDAVETANIRQFSTGKFLYGSQNVDFQVRIENQGNVLVRPTGPLEIYNALGARVGEVAFNDTQAGVFPNDTREFALTWEGDEIGFGRYEAILSPVYGLDGARKTMSSTVTFWILPFSIIGPVLGVLAVVLLVTVIGVRIYIKRKVAQLSVGRRVVRRKQAGGQSLLLVTLLAVLVVLAIFLLVMLLLFA